VCRTTFSSACQLMATDANCQSGLCCVTTPTATGPAGSTVCNPDGSVNGSLIPCGYDCNNDGKIKNVSGSPPEECGFNTLVVMTQNIINFLLYSMAAPIAAVMFLYAGYLLLTNRGNESQVTKAKAIFVAVFWGLVVALSAWLIVNFILDFFVGTNPLFRKVI